MSAATMLLTSPVAVGRVRLLMAPNQSEYTFITPSDCPTNQGCLMGWLKQLKEQRGSRPRCLLLTDGAKGEVAERLTRLVGRPDVVVTAEDRWMPCGKPVQRANGSWDKTPTVEARLQELCDLLPGNARQRTEISGQLRDWWLAVPRNANTPNWDIASTGIIDGNQGLLLVEAKAHGNELSAAGKSFTNKSNEKNHYQIGRAIAEATTGLKSATGDSWSLSRDNHYQISNRFAWSWKLASLGVPVVLVYLGFLKASEMARDGKPFKSENDWACVLRGHAAGIVDNACWGEPLRVGGTPFLPLIRSCEQPLH